MDQLLHDAVCVTCILAGAGLGRRDRRPLPSAPGCPADRPAGPPARR